MDADLGALRRNIMDTSKVYETPDSRLMPGLTGLPDLNPLLGDKRTRRRHACSID